MKRILIIDSSIGGPMLKTNLNDLFPVEVQVDVEQEAQGKYDVIFIATQNLLSNPLTLKQLKKKYGSPLCKIVAVTNENILSEVVTILKKVDQQIKRSVALASDGTNFKAFVVELLNL